MKQPGRALAAARPDRDRPALERPRLLQGLHQETALQPYESREVPRPPTCSVGCFATPVPFGRSQTS